MDLPRLETFVRAAEYGSFNQAAEAGNITSTAVIKQMNLLEDEIGAKLFDRTHRGLRLTKGGESFYKDAKYILKYLHESELRARKTMHDDGNLVRIGTSPLTPAEAFVRIWPQIHALCPDLRFRIDLFENTPENAAEILGNLGQNIDVVLGIFDQTLLELRKCDGFILYDIPICVAVPLDHPLADRTVLEVSDMIVIDNRTGESALASIDPENVGVWKNGILEFKGAGIKEVIRTLERTFGVSIDCPENEKFADARITAKFSKSQTLTEILDILKKLIPEMEYRVDGSKVYLY